MVKVSTPLLHLQGVSKTYHHNRQELTLLEEADFQLNPSEIVAVVGPSGTGKSTFLHLCGLLDQGDTGHDQVFFKGQACHKLSNEQKAHLRCRQMGFIYQYHHLLADLNALENVMIPLLLGGQSIEKARLKAQTMLEAVGLKDRQKHYPPQLSGGEQQRVSIARALVHQPSLILADEPTGDLDQETAHQVFRLLTEAVQDLGASMIMVTHNTALAEQAHRVMTLEKGKVVPRESL